MKNRVSRCPTCGSRRIKVVKKDFVGDYKGRKYTVANLEYRECPDCGEQMFDGEAMSRIEEVSPAYAHSTKRKAA